jgi:hypothetical protein
MQITAEHVVVVVRGGVVDDGVDRRVVVVVVVGGGAPAVVVVVVVVEVLVVVVVLVDDDADDCGVALVVAVAPADCEAGGIGSTAPNSDGSFSGRSSPSVPKANNVQAIAPTTAPTASRPCPFCRVDPIGVLRVSSSDHW